MRRFLPVDHWRESALHVLVIPEILIMMSLGKNAWEQPQLMCYGTWESKPCWNKKRFENHSPQRHARPQQRNLILIIRPVHLHGLMQAMLQPLCDATTIKSFCGEQRLATLLVDLSFEVQSRRYPNTKLLPRENKAEQRTNTDLANKKNYPANSQSMNHEVAKPWLRTRKFLSSAVCSEMVVCEVELFLKRWILRMAKKNWPEEGNSSGIWATQHALKRARFSQILFWGQRGWIK